MTLRKILLVWAAICLVSVFGAGQALAGGSVFGGMSLPLGDFNDAAKTGYHLGASIEKSLVPKFDVGGRAAYNFWTAEAVDNLRLNSLEILVFGKVSVPGGPFVLAGAGLSNTGGSFYDERNTDVSYAFGGGYSLVKAEFTLLYHSINTDPESTNYITASIGLRF